MNQDINSIETFVFAGCAIFTIENIQNGKRCTYKVAKKGERLFVSALVGPSNTQNYIYIGMAKNKTFTRTKSSNFTEESQQFRGFSWLYQKITKKEELPAIIKFHHAGYCGKCGRLLTTPESVESGYGPVCFSRMF